MEGLSKGRVRVRVRVRVRPPPLGSTERCSQRIDCSFGQTAGIIVVIIQVVALVELQASLLVLLQVVALVTLHSWHAIRS